MDEHPKKKRILIFSTAYEPFIGGAEVAVKEITNRIDDCEFVMVTAKMKSNLPSVEKIGNVLVYRIGIGIRLIDKLYLALFGHKKALQLHKEKKFDLVWSVMASYSGFAALSFRQKTGIKFLLTLQEGDPVEYILKKVRFVRKRFDAIFSSADYIQAISTYLAKWAKDMGARCPVEVIPNGVDVYAFRNTYNVHHLTDDSRFVERKHFGIDHKGLLVLTVSRLVKKNGLDILLQSLKSLPPEYRLAIAGNGEEENNLKRLVGSLKLQERVYFLGFLRDEKLRLLYSVADVFCRPSRSEGMGNVFLEAMAARLPVVATRIGGIPDIVEHERTGLLCPVGDVDCIEQSIQRFVDDNDLRVRCIEEANRKITEFGWDVIADRMKNIFDKVCVSS